MQHARTAALGRSLLDRPKTAPQGGVDGDTIKPKSTRTETAPVDQSFLDCSIRPSRSRRTGQQVVVMSRRVGGSARATSNQINGAKDDPSLHYAKFTASAAKTPLQRSSTESSLKSCLSTSSGSSLLLNGMNKSSSMTKTNSTTKGAGSTKNEEFKLVRRRRVSFTEERVREYEVTLGDNPSVSSGLPVSLGWRYNPEEKISDLEDNHNCFDSNQLRGNTSTGSTGRRRSAHELQIPEQERRQSLIMNPSVSAEDMRRVLRTNAKVQIERRASLEELISQKQYSEERMKRKERRELIKKQVLEKTNDNLGKKEDEWLLLQQ